jgi:hypothetical protein
MLLNIICAIKRRKVSQVRPVACSGLTSANFIRKTLRKISCYNNIKVDIIENRLSGMTD